MYNEDGGRSGPVEKTDRISSLPDEIKELILCFLPICDAVRTSVLSQKWKFSWTRAGQLNLNFNKHNEKYLSEEYMSKDKYCRLVGKILLSHVGMIHKVVWEPIWHDLEEDYDWTGKKGWRYLDEDMNTWLQSLSRKGIKDIAFDFRRGTSFGFVGPEDIEKFDPSSSLFRCVGLSSLSLKHCNLRSCIAFKGFPYLVKLELSEVDVYNDILERISSSCPLEVLSLDWCNFMCGRTAISAPQLKIFKLVRAFPEHFPCYLKFAPNLRMGLFKMDALDEEADLLSSNCFDIFSPIPLIEEFAFNCRQHKTSASDTVPQRFSEVLGNLRTVTLDDFDPCSKDHRSFMLCIFSSSPCLETLTINMLVEYKPLQEPTKAALKAARANIENMGKVEIKTRIKTLSLFWYELRTVSEIAFIQCIVSCCPILEKLDIKAPSAVIGTIKQEVNNFLKQLGRSSTIPKIIFTNAR